MSANPPPLFIEAIYPPHQLRTATAGRRLGAWALDFLLFVFTVTIGWLIWFIIVAPRGQSPGKQLLGLNIIRSDGARAGGGYTWLREVVVKWILFFVCIAALTSFIVPVIGAAWLLWDKQRQALWDKITDTHIAHSPDGFRPLTLEEMQVKGVTPPVVPTPPLAPTTPASTGAVPDQLRDLKKLLDEGLITPQEYEQRRRRLIDRL